jgi:PIN domain nuclease of toxin-antitoxin system
MSAVVADTHAAVWLLFSPDKLSVDALAALNSAVEAGDSIYLASISWWKLPT